MIFSIRRVRILLTLFSLLLVMVAGVLLLGWCGPEQPTPTATLTATLAPSPTSTLQPTRPQPTAPPTRSDPTVTLEPSPTVTPTRPQPTATLEPTATPETIEVYTGWVLGHLFFRRGPDIGFVSIWPVNALPEGTVLVFQSCTPFGWAQVHFAGETGFVKSKYTFPDRCGE